ncbi:MULTISPECIES: two-component system sensor histidine kinase RcsC [Brenneria]|uniref:Sensor histidine kinase RcsC n=1 Tax=Brenneria nigrifluens DSM 30175 = ATCC 13028 TaxID=1121120 RepID=A0A2U1UWI3_9GAMM|nr:MULTISPECIES: two-component system sensor histidine kinase RcsC [Brenneria]EHD22595.1 integral membrane sensor hybrid histidine kinase [Brenneria sp. EniD312]PWC26035.1 two-component system sensor histidine kinase RcsC [Brenneria nigrifluens DSM 30175 = ATCC 13028]QCR05581.1 two-component system sensor histidine kinase RcsC [Brenneria nigrifluens DSM 30175 = ATCC 13028]
MKYLASFHTTLKVSRYLFRVLATMLWVLGALISLFYISKALNEKESELRQEYNLSFDQSQGYIRHAADIVRELKYLASNRLMNVEGNQPRRINEDTALSIYPLSPGANCSANEGENNNPLASLNDFFNGWRENFSAVYDLNRVFFVGGDRRCMVDFGIRNQALDRDNLLKNVQDRFLEQKNTIQSVARDETLYWITPASIPDVGYLYALTPIYVDNKLEVIMGIEQTIRLDDFVTLGKFPISAKLLNQYNQTVLQFAEGGGRHASSVNSYPIEHNYFGYVNGYDEIILKKNLPPTAFSIIYSLPLKVLLSHIGGLIMNMALLNALSAILLFVLAWVFERKMLLPAEVNAFQLEENEQFNRKIVASAPVGICILRINDGTNILSNELAHNYLNLLTHEDRLRITRIICEQQSKFVDVMTSRNDHLQISFVHSRYRNENVAICVLSDVSARVKMEESLQEMANAAEQASQSKSMFLATVSHELRTPLYGIIGNLDLLQTKALPKDANRLVAAMNNSSSLLLKIISDILDFSKIESEQLKIEPCDFAPHEVISHITSNYLPLVVKKRLSLYCFIDPNVPVSLSGDPVRLQQVLSNLLSNAIKFTDTGCIIFQVGCRDGYLEFLVRDTGMGIPARETMKLFDPFFQAGSGVQRHFQGTGLGLAICEKLVNLMDGDITIESEPGLGSQFGVRIPLYKARYVPVTINGALQGKICWLMVRNVRLESYLLAFLQAHGLQACRHQRQTIGANDVIISDYTPTQTFEARAQIVMSGAHTGSAQQVSPGRWLHSTSTPQYLPDLLEKIYLPEASDASHSTLSSPLTNYNRIENGDIMILVVDDHPINRRLLADQLGSLGYMALTANDGVDALSVLSKNTVDIVLTDVNMPNMDGYRLTQRLRELKRTFPVIGVTANALAEERQRCLQSGMDNCLSKPVTLDTLQQTLFYYSNVVRQTREAAPEI